MRDDLARQGKPYGSEFCAHGRLHLTAGSSVAGKQHLHFLPQLRIIAASLIQQPDALLGFALRGAMEQLFDLRPAFRIQLAPTRLHVLKEPRFSHPQIPPDGDSRHVQRLRNLIHG